MLARLQRLTPYLPWLDAWELGLEGTEHSPGASVQDLLPQAMHVLA